MAMNDVQVHNLNLRAEDIFDSHTIFTEKSLAS